MATAHKRNGLVELFRFFCSVWVAYFHGFFPILSDKFNGGDVSVDFFFIVTGFFFLQSIEAYRKKRFFEGVRFLLLSKTKKIPLIIAALSILYCNIAFELDFGGFNWPLSFLWFFVAQFVYTTIFYLLYKIIKKCSTFNIVCIVIICLSMCFFRLGIKQLDIPGRGPAMIAFGILISQLPKIKIRAKNTMKARRWSLAINIIGFIISASAFACLAYFPRYDIWQLHLSCCVVCPALLYFATALPVHSKILNFLGEFSVFIYLGQCPILLHHYYVSKDTRDQFPWLCVCAVALFIINRIVNAIIRRRKLARV